MGNTKRSNIIPLVVVLVSSAVGAVKWPEPFGAYLWGFCALGLFLGILLATKKDNEDFAELKREIAENAGFVVGIGRLPADTYEVIGKISSAEGDHLYGHIVRSLKTARYHCISHEYELPDVFVIDSNGKTYDSQRHSGRVLLKGTVS